MCGLRLLALGLGLSPGLALLAPRPLALVVGSLPPLNLGVGLATLLHLGPPFSPGLSPLDLAAVRLCAAPRVLHGLSALIPRRLASRAQRLPFEPLLAPLDVGYPLARRPLARSQGSAERITRGASVAQMVSSTSNRCAARETRRRSRPRAK